MATSLTEVETRRRRVSFCRVLHPCAVYKGGASKQVARTCAFQVRGSALVILTGLEYSSAVSRLRRPFLSDRYFFITVRSLRTRTALSDADFAQLALAFNRGRALRPYYLTAWVFLPDHWHIICGPRYPLTISQVIKSLKTSSTILINRQRAETGELWQSRFFDRALRNVKEYSEKVQYIHLNPVRAGLVGRPQDWRWSSVNEYSGMSAAEQKKRCGLTIDRVRIPCDPKARL